MAEWRSETSVRTRPLRRALQPFRERRFTYEAYDRFLGRLGDARYRVVRLRELAETPRDRVLVGLRHDVDERLESALRFGELEHARGLRATYFVLHTASYWRKPALLEKLRRLQALGHEIGWHNDLVTLELVHRCDPVEYLRRELARLREAGIDVIGVAAHGSPWCHLLRFRNDAFFADFPEAGRPRGQSLRQGRLADFGLAYDAYRLGEDSYFSDARFDRRGRRWHPDLLNLDALRPGEVAIVLTHPCHWDASLWPKLARLPRRLAGKPRELLERRRVLARTPRRG